MWNCVSYKVRSICKNSDSFKITAKSKHNSSAMSSEITEKQITEYLRSNVKFLERYIVNELNFETLERLMESKRGKNQTSQSSVRKDNKKQLLENLSQSLQSNPTKNYILWELANYIRAEAAADGFRLYIPNINDLEFRPEGSEKSCLLSLTDDNSIPSRVAKTFKCVRKSKNCTDETYTNSHSFEGDSTHVLCHPILQPDGQIAGILELWRTELPFVEEDEEVVSEFLHSGATALHFDHLYQTMNKQKKLNDFLLAVVKSIFQAMVSMDALVIKIMNFAQRLVDADRASLFLVDTKNKDLYATVFDVGIENIDAFECLVKPHTPKEIRFPLGTGIAGHVAETGEVLNIPDAYADDRFNRTVDQLTGYRTNTILCMPIFIRGSVIGVVQMVNKHGGRFTGEDEQAFEMFAVYCGLALHHAKLYDRIRKSEQKYRVALEVLSYHNTCAEEEVEVLKGEGVVEAPGVDDYYFNPFELKEQEMVRYAIYMFTDLFGISRFEKDHLMRFALTVRKNYRRVPYHNWVHGFSVANCMYAIIKNSETKFRPNESLALYIAALCHDLDHRGKNNKFMLETESPLAMIYSTSTMEHHHFNQTVTILQQEGHNIFSKLSNDEYKQVLSAVKHCILATDLALFFPNKEKLSQIIHDGSFSWNNEDHRLLVQAIGMTASDLAASAKPWNVQVKTVEIIFEEFYQQGDAEKASGRKPLLSMDRTQPNQQAACQVGFLTTICIPCYSLLYALIPGTKPLLDMCQENLQRWRDIDGDMRTHGSKK